MSLGLSVTDLNDLRKIDAALKQNDPKGQFASLDMGEVIIERDISAYLCPLVNKYLNRLNDATPIPAGSRARVGLIVDRTDILRNGASLKTNLTEQLRQQFDVEMIILDDGQDVLHATEAVLDQAAASALGCNAIVSIGGGTISDIAKIAALRNSIQVHILVQTAASVDGYTDNFSVILEKGVKKTVLSRWPQAVLADVQTIVDAPIALTAAGMGEMMSMFCAPGDWYLASQIGVDHTFTPVLLELLSLCGQNIEKWSQGLTTGIYSDVEQLTCALDLRGIVTGVGGTTATLSGMEHLFSHMLDMIASYNHTKMASHGAQVGVGAILRAATWDVFCNRMRVDGFPIHEIEWDETFHQDRAIHAFGTLDPSGKIGQECASRYTKKLRLIQASKDRFFDVIGDWDTHQLAHNALTFSTEKIAQYLHRASAPMHINDLDLNIAGDQLRWIIANSHFMRERVTIADFMHLAGWFDPTGLDHIVTTAESIIKQTRGTDQNAV